MDLITAIQGIVPRVAPGYVTRETCAPFAYYVDSMSAVQTCDGIAGYEGELSISVVAKTKTEAEVISDRLISALNAKTFDDGRDLYYASRNYVAYPDEGLASYELIFNSIKI